MTREVWQSYDCPQGVDIDLFDEALVYCGASIQCAGCGNVHIAGVDVQVSTYVDDGEMSYPALPEGQQELAQLLNGLRPQDG